MGYGKKKKSKKKITGKSLIQKNSVETPPTPDVSETSTSNVSEAPAQASGYGAASGGPPPEFSTSTDKNIVEVEEELKDIVFKLYDGSNIRKFYGMDTMDIQTFISTVLKDVPVVRIDQLNDKNETVSSYEIDETDVIKQPLGMSNVKTNTAGISEKDGKSDGKGGNK